MSDIRVFLLDDHEVLRAGLRVLLEREPGFAVSGDARTAEDALMALASPDGSLTDVVVADVALGASDGVDFVRALRRKGPTPHVLILSGFSSPELIIEAFDAGVRGFAQKSQPPTELFEALKDVAAGRTYLAPAISPTVLEGRGKPLPRGRHATGTLACLSPRERELFDLAVRGITNEEAARLLGISVKTVETHRAKINDKLGVHSAAHLIRFAARRGLASN